MYNSIRCASQDVEIRKFNKIVGDAINPTHIPFLVSDGEGGYEPFLVSDGSGNFIPLKVINPE